MTNQVYQIITDQIIEMLEDGTAPWKAPFTNGMHKSAASKKPYRGLNQMMLNYKALKNEYKSPYWITYNQAKKVGAQVRKGEKSTVIQFWKFFKKVDEDGEPTGKKSAMLRYYRVFNIEQVDGLDMDKFTVELLDFEPIQEAQRIIDEMPNPPSLDHGGSRAYYQPSTDHVQLPEQEYFDSAEVYYSVAFHELAHSTGGGIVSGIHYLIEELEKMCEYHGIAENDCQACQQEHYESEVAYDAWCAEQEAMAEEAMIAEERARECAECWRNPNYTGQYCNGCPNS
jgi:antirestriction protein ArdC